MTVPGIRSMISTAVVAAIGEGEAFDRGRDFAAWVVLIPRQYSTNGRMILGASPSAAAGTKDGLRSSGEDHHDATTSVSRLQFWRLASASFRTHASIQGRGCTRRQAHPHGQEHSETQDGV